MKKDTDHGATQDRRSTEEVIRIRTHLALLALGAVLVAVIAVKVALADFGQVFANFQFNDLLALILALFSVGVAIVFYLKATESSNAFYHNSYQFTKEVSEILGRVEAGFGERLRHLDEGYAGVRDRLDKMPFDAVKTEKKIGKEKEQVERVERERQAIFEDLARRAKLEQKEKEALFLKLREQEEELLSARRDLSRLQRRLIMQERGSRDPEHVYPPVVQVLRNYILEAFPPGYLRRMPSRLLNERFRHILAGMPEDSRAMLREFEIVDEEGDLTPSGLDLLRQLSIRQGSSESPDR